MSSPRIPRTIATSIRSCFQASYLIANALHEFICQRNIPSLYYKINMLWVFGYEKSINNINKVELVQVGIIGSSNREEKYISLKFLEQDHFYPRSILEVYFHHSKQSRSPWCISYSHIILITCVLSLVESSRRIFSRIFSRLWLQRVRNWSSRWKHLNL